MSPTRVPAVLGLLAALVLGAAPAAQAAVSSAAQAAVPPRRRPPPTPRRPPTPPLLPPPPAASTQVSWGVRPADTVHGAERPNFAYSLAPGGTLSDALVVTNRGDAPLALDVYAADGFLTADGTLDVLEAGEESTALGSWVQVATPEVVVAPGESLEVPFTVTVPEGVQPGDYAAGVVSSLLVENAAGVSVDRRLGSRMHVRVGGDLAPALTVSDVRVDWSAGSNPVTPGTAAVTFTVTNTGNARIAPAEQVQVSGLMGLGRARAAAVEVPELIPGASVERTVTVDGVWPLVRTTARVALGGEVVALPAAAGTTTAAAEPAPAVPGVVATAADWAVPWPALALVALLVLLVVWRVRARRRRRTAHQREVDDAVAAALARQGAATT
ncbi:DUF916 domain-containing protein [Cellulomonas endometrii]|uniref:DUF916 domain-containing protein n=1 Tax=Cellulomonas endometrii TaxID=3036301 RepID=UPI0024ADFA75|nr:DUF916 domain-containing protein [Cellulomonas endometrii]